MSNFTTGYSHALLLSNLIKHFNPFEIFIQPIEDYQSGELLYCNYNFYIGSYYNSRIPSTFLNEALHQPTTLVWMGYNIWQLGNLFTQFFGYQFNGLTKLNPFILNPNGLPSFFSDIIYKNYVFKKEISDTPLILTRNLPYELSMLYPTYTLPAPPPLAIVKNPWSNETLPYVLQNSNKFYFTENPLTYMSESEHFLILSDLLFNIFNTRPKNGPQVGVTIYTNDIINLSPSIEALTDELKKANVPYFLSVSPESPVPRVEKTQLQNKSKNLILGQSQGILWDLRSSKNYKNILDFVSNLKKQQSQFIKWGLTPLSIIDTEPSNSPLENSIIAQLFTQKIGHSEVYNFLSLPTFMSPTSSPTLSKPLVPTLSNETTFPSNKIASSKNTWFPIEDSAFRTLLLKSPQVISDFHQSQFTPYIIPSDISLQKIIPLLITVESDTDFLSLTHKVQSLSLISDSFHFISLNENRLDNPSAQEKVLKLIQYYKSLNYHFIKREELQNY